MFGQARDRSIMGRMAKQILPGDSKFLQECYEMIMDSGFHKYIFLNLHPNDRMKYFIRNSVFPEDPDLEIYCHVKKKA